MQASEANAGVTRGKRRTSLGAGVGGVVGGAWGRCGEEGGGWEEEG